MGLENVYDFEGGGLVIGQYGFDDVEVFRRVYRVYFLDIFYKIFFEVLFSFFQFMRLFR